MMKRIKEEDKEWIEVLARVPEFSAFANQVLNQRGVSYRQLLVLKRMKYQHEQEGKMCKDTYMGVKAVSPRGQTIIDKLHRDHPEGDDNV